MKIGKEEGHGGGGGRHSSRNYIFSYQGQGDYTFIFGVVRCDSVIVVLYPFWPLLSILFFLFYYYLFCSILLFILVQCFY